MTVFISFLVPALLYEIYQRPIRKKTCSFFSAIEFSVIVFLLDYFTIIVTNHNPEIVTRLSSSLIYCLKYNIMSFLFSCLLLAFKEIAAKNTPALYRLKESSNCILILEAVFLGAAIFTAIYGIRVLNPTYTDWLMNEKDISHNYLAWCFFRTSKWQFPIGLYDRLTYPFSVSIIYSDAIPLFAVFFKLISFALPDTFQYLGLWGILSFSLQCMIGTILCKKYCDKNLLALLGGILLTISPVIIQRMFGHTALASHWIILLSWIPIVYPECFEKKKDFVFWLCLGILCASIHVYFIPLCGISLCAYILKKFIDEKNILVIFNVIFYIAGGLFALWILGGFSSGANYEGGGFGLYLSNLNTYYNSLGISTILGNFDTYSSYQQYEGFGYLGVGMIILSIISLVAFLNEFLDSKTEKRRYVLKLLPYLMVFVISTLVAIIPNITINDTLLFEINLPNFLVSIMKIFRANGRFIWGGVYAISISALFILLRKYKANVAFIILAVCISLQFYDLSDWLSDKYTSFSEVKNYDSILADDVWEQISEMGFEHIYVSEIVASTETTLRSIAKWADEHSMTMNRFSFARSMDGDLDAVWSEKIINPDETDLFIFDVNDFGDYYDFDYLYYIDGFVIGTCVELDEAQRYDSQQWILGTELFSKNGNAESDEDNIICHSGGGIYGPYISIPAGTYQISYVGENLQESSFDCVGAQGSQQIDIEVISVTSNKIVYEITLEEREEDIEFRLSNNSDEDIILSQVEVKKID